MVLGSELPSAGTYALHTRPPTGGAVLRGSRTFETVAQIAELDC